MTSETKIPEVGTKTASSSAPSSSVHHESFTGPLVLHKLDGKNYLQWSQSIQMHVAGRGKIGYLTGTAEKPSESEASYQTWYENDNLVRSWLITSMQTNIGENYLLHQSAREVWDDAKETYSTIDNSAALFEVETRLYNLKQGEMSTTDYFNVLGRCWLQLDTYEVQPWDTTKDASLFKKFIEKKRTFQFLLGLNSNLDDAKSRIMSTKPFPTLREAFSEIRQEEFRRQLMLQESKTQTESSAMITQASQPATQSSAMVAAQGNRNYRGKRKSIPTCDHCKKLGHSKEECWEIVGRPADWKSRYDREHKANAATTSSNAGRNGDPGVLFTKQQMDQLQQMFSKFSTGQSSQGSRVTEDDWQD
ncbi:hypothetical protein LINPERHAP1_LOCUS34642 [Linum perenne]